MGSATGSWDLELMLWLRGAHQAGPATAAPPASPLPVNWRSAVGAQPRCQPGEPTSTPAPQWRKPAERTSALWQIRQQTLKKKKSLQGCACTSFRSGGNHHRVVCKEKGAVFPPSPHSSSPAQSLFRLCSPFLPSPVIPLYIHSVNPGQSWLVSAVTPQILQQNSSFWQEVEDRKERGIPNL